MEGPTKDVQMAQSQIEVIVTDLVSLIIPVMQNQKWYHRNDQSWCYKNEGVFTGKPNGLHRDHSGS